jgi:hypothetical protein
MTNGTLPTDAAERAKFPMADGLLYYFPNALAEVSAVSRIGNEQHNPGEPMHWAREKSTDHANKILRHLIDAGTMDTDGTRHSAKVAWRALAMLEDELIAEGRTPGRNARITETPVSRHSQEGFAEVLEMSTKINRSTP